MSELLDYVHCILCPLHAQNYRIHSISQDTIQHMCDTGRNPLNSCRYVPSETDYDTIYLYVI